MPDMWLKAPNSNYVAVVGSPIEAATLRSQGYIDTEPPQDVADAVPDPKEKNEHATTDDSGSGTEDVSASPPAPTISGRGKTKP